MINAVKLAADIVRGRVITRETALSLWDKESYELFYGANLIRQSFKGNKINLCAIINAKSGACSENCAFCAQSGRHKAMVDKYPLVGMAAVRKNVDAAVKNRASCFGIVTSGNALSSEEIDKLSGYVSKNAGRGVSLSGSLGSIGLEEMKTLKKAGLKRFHHNIETAESFFKKICQTHIFEDRIKTARNVKKAGLELCCGGIFGLGESRVQRIEFAFTLKGLGVDSVPLNFLNPVAGTPLAGQKPLSCEEILKSIAITRYILPEKDISVCGGREINLRDTQSWIFFAGANGMMIGNYLTTSGRNVERDLKMIRDLGLEIK